MAVLLSSIFIVVYLAFRFAIGGFVEGLKYGVAAIIAMLHDVAVLVGVFCVLGHYLNWKIDSLFVTAALTVIGFSVHDTIVIFDRIRENLKLHGRSESFVTIVNNSINETFARSIFTSLTVIITLLALLFLGGPVIRPLNAALLVGIISGTYSSIFNAAPLVVDWQRLWGKKSGVPERRPAAAGGTPPPRPSPSSPSVGAGRAGDRPSVSPAAPRGTKGDGSSPAGNGAGGYSSTPKPPLPPGPPRPRRRRM
jgi:preprotein translocase subunit SecF